MSDFKTRLIQERDELQEKYQKLSLFMCSPAFNELDKLHRDLLQQQHCHMNGYLLTLTQRLDNL